MSGFPSTPTSIRSSSRITEWFFYTSFQHGESHGAIFRCRSLDHFSTFQRRSSSVRHHRCAACGRVVPLWSLLEETAFSTPTEFRKSEHVTARAMKRATTISADVIVLCQWCGVQVVHKKVGHATRPPARAPYGSCEYTYRYYCFHDVVAA